MTDRRYTRTTGVCVCVRVRVRVKIHFILSRFTRTLRARDVIIRPLGRVTSIYIIYIYNICGGTQNGSRFVPVEVSGGEKIRTYISYKFQSRRG